MEIKVIENINKELFNIYDDKNILPIALNIDGIYYQICGFQVMGNEYIYYGKYNKNDAINLAVSFINNITFTVLARLVSICRKLNIDTNEINVFKEKNIKGNKSFDTLEKSLKLPENLLYFIDKKDIPLKTISLIINQQEHIINFIAEHIKYNDLSVQSFRKYVEKICDFKEVIPEKYLPNFSFQDRRSKSHIEIDEEYTKLINSFKNIKINNLDNFETPILNISFEIKSVEEYNNMLLLLENNKDNINLFYQLLEEKGLL